MASEEPVLLQQMSKCNAGESGAHLPDKFAASIAARKLFHGSIHVDEFVGVEKYMA